jgi:hypothetical protein
MLTAISRGAGLLAHDAPLARRRKARAAQAAQAGVFQRGYHLQRVVFVLHHGGGQTVAALGAVVA